MVSADEKYSLRREGGTLFVVLSGDWSLEQGIPSRQPLQEAIREKPPVDLCFDASKLGAWDSALVTFVLGLDELVSPMRVQVDCGSLPKGAQDLYHLATAVPEKDTAKGSDSPGFFTKVGLATLALQKDLGAILEFIGELTLSFGRFFTGRAQFRWRDLWLTVQQSGPEALAIVALINLLVGVILAFVGALQLAQFGAEIYVANLVGIATAREMAPMMTGIILCGRTGAAFAAELGSMKITEEIDALKTLGIAPMDFLVLPRTLAFVLMMPLLVVFADFIGIFGGVIISVLVLEIPPEQYIDRTIQAVTLATFLTGVIKSVVFGVLIAGAGCLRGMQTGNSADAVGVSATSAVVTGITAIVVADAIFAVLLNVLGLS